jgi:transposase
MKSSIAMEGATTVCGFEACVEHLLAPALRLGRVVVMDDLGAHRPGRVRQWIEDRDYEPIYLTPYSPDRTIPVVKVGVLVPCGYHAPV